MMAKVADLFLNGSVGNLGGCICAIGTQRRFFG